MSACVQKALCEQWTDYSSPLLRHSCSGLVEVLSSSSLVFVLLGSREGANSWEGWMGEAAVQLHGH